MPALESAKSESYENFSIPATKRAGYRKQNVLVSILGGFQQDSLFLLEKSISRLGPRVAVELKAFGYSERGADKVARDFLRLLSGLLLTRRMAGPIKLGETTEQFDVRCENEVFRRVLKAVTPDLVEIFTEIANNETADERGGSHDWLLVLTRLCNAWPNSNGMEKADSEGLADALLTWSRTNTPTRIVVS